MREEFKKGGVDWQGKVRLCGAEGKEKLMIGRSSLAGKVEASRS
jgi:hypothetical protein